MIPEIAPPAVPAAVRTVQRFEDISIRLGPAYLVHELSLEIQPRDRLLVTADSGQVLRSLAFALGGLMPSPWRRKLSGKHDVLSRRLRSLEPSLFKCNVTSESPLPVRRTLLVPEDLDPWFVAASAEDELRTMGWMPGRDPRVDTAIRQLVTADLLGRPIYSLSGGEKQSLAIASVIAASPSLAVLVNSLAWLDAEHRPLALQILASAPFPIVFCDCNPHHSRAIASRWLHLGADGSADWLSLTDHGEATATTPATVGAPAEPVPSTCPAGSITASNLGFTFPGYREVRIFHGATFSAPFVGDAMLTGRNGAGKSTLALLLCGLERRYEGTLLCDLQSVGCYTPHHLARLLGPARPQILFQFTVENLIRPSVREYLHLGDLPIPMAILDGLYDYGVSEDTSMGDLDLLQRKLTVIARAGASGSIMLFLDEPLAGLTQAEARSLLNFSRMALPNTMRIWVSHDRIPGLVPEAYLRVAEGAVWVEESKGV